MITGKKQYLWMPVLPVFIFIIINLCLDLCYYQDYRDKMGIVEQMLPADHTQRMDTAAAILKYGTAGAEKGAAILKQYGYENTHNRFYQTFVNMCLMTALLSGGALALIWLAVAWRRKKEQAAQDVWLWQLGQYLFQLREGSGDLHMLPQTEDTQGPACRVNEQLELLLEHLDMTKQQSEREKESIKKLVTDISHQLKTPVAALDTCFSVLDDSTLSQAEREEFYQRCHRQLEALKELLDSLIQVSRLEAGMIQLELGKAPVLDTVIAAVNRVYPKASAKQLEFVFDYDQTMEDIFVLQDEKDFQAVLPGQRQAGPAGKRVRRGAVSGQGDYRKT